MESIKLIYEDSRLLDEIVQAVEAVRNKVTSTEELEERIFQRLSRYIKGDPEKARHRNILIRMTYETISEMDQRYRKEHYEHFSAFNKSNRADGSETEFEPEDVLADVEGKIVEKEMAALLAQDDRRNSKIVDMWAIGNTNNAQISRLLAQSFGGNPESHRRYIHRYQQSCRELLESAI